MEKLNYLPSLENFQEEKKEEKLLSEVEKSFDKLYISYDVMDLIHSHDYLKKAINDVCHYDENTRDHVLRVSNFASIIANQNLEEEDKTLFIKAALLHDVGKIGIEEVKLEGKLSDEQFNKIKKHIDNGVEWISLNLPPEEAKEINKIIAAHHEFQRNSYRRKGEERRQEQIKINTEKRKKERREHDPKAHKMARWLAMIDAFDAITDKRPGNPAKSIDFAKEELEKNFTEEEDKIIINSLTNKK